MQRELARGLEADCHIGKTEGDGLVLEDPLAEGRALMGIAHRNLERRARHAYALGGDANTTAFQVGERNAIAASLLTQQAIGGNSAILEPDLTCVGRILAHLLLDTRNDVARRLRID